MHDTLKALLKTSGFSLTKPRRMVFDLLVDQKPQSIRELVAAAIRIDRATVYRTVELFEKLGIVSRVNVGWKPQFELSEVFQGHHHHFHCSKCGQTFSMLNSTMLETMIDTIAKKSDFIPRGHQLEVEGLCAKCAKL